MIYDWRVNSLEEPPPGPHRVTDAQTGQELLAVFYIDTVTGEYGRYQLDPADRVQGIARTPRGGPIKVWGCCPYGIRIERATT